MNMGNYGYLSAKPHAVTRVDNTDHLINSTSQQITYNPYGKAALIVEGDSSQVLFYGPDKTRWLQVDSVNGQVAAKTYYFDDFELRVAGNHTRKYQSSSGGCCHQQWEHNNKSKSGSDHNQGFRSWIRCGIHNY